MCLFALLRSHAQQQQQRSGETAETHRTVPVISLEGKQQTVKMSMEAQYYEAKRRQHILERRQSLRTQNEIDQQARPIDRKPLKPFTLPVRVNLPHAKPMRCTCTPMKMVYLDDSEPVSFERHRDIYP